MANELDHQRGELKNEKIEIVSGSFRILIKWEDVKKLEDYDATLPKRSEICMKNWRAKVKPVLTPHYL